MQESVRTVTSKCESKLHVMYAEDIRIATIFFFHLVTYRHLKKTVSKGGFEKMSLFPLSASGLIIEISTYVSMNLKDTHLLAGSK